MIYVDLNAELKGRILELESQLVSLKSAGCDPASMMMQSALRDLQRCQRWLALLSGTQRPASPAPGTVAREVGKPDVAKRAEVVGALLPKGSTPAGLRPKLGAPVVRA